MRKHLLYLTNTHLTARMWQGGMLSDERKFENDEVGWRALTDHLVINKYVPVYLLIDLIEEDFQNDTIPHLFGKARKSLIERRLLQIYRDTPFRHANFQGREKTARKDDRMLFSALTNATLIKPWIDAILKEQLPFAGIYSTALLSNVLFNRLHLGKGQVLFIVHQSTGLRQSYFREGHLRFSRLTQLSSHDPHSIAEIANQEMGKTRQFLSNTRLLQRGESLEIVALDNADVLQEMQVLNAGSSAATYRYIDPVEVIGTLGFKHLPEIEIFDSLFLSLLGIQPPPSHFVLPEQRRTYLLWQSRIFLYIFGAIALTGCLIWSGVDAVNAVSVGNQLKRLEQDTSMYQRNKEDLSKSMPKMVANPHDMKSAVGISQLIVQNTPIPNVVLGVISNVLDRMPQINLIELNWSASDKNDVTEIDPNTQAAVASAMPPAASIGVPTKPFEIVTIKGEVLPFNNDYRTALQKVNQFSDELMKDKHIRVNITHQPLDIRPSVSLAGQSGNESEPTSATFELRLVWSP